MSRMDFYTSTDLDGNMPVLSLKPLPFKKAWVKYVNDIPVEIKPYRDQDRVWDYSKSTFLGLSASAKDYLGVPFKPYQGAILCPHKEIV